MRSFLRTCAQVTLGLAVVSTSSPMWAATGDVEPRGKGTASTPRAWHLGGRIHALYGRVIRRAGYTPGRLVVVKDFRYAEEVFRPDQEHLVARLGQAHPKGLAGWDIFTGDLGGEGDFFAGDQRDRASAWRAISAPVAERLLEVAKALGDKDSLFVVISGLYPDNHVDRLRNKVEAAGLGRRVVTLVTDSRESWPSALANDDTLKPVALDVTRRYPKPLAGELDRAAERFQLFLSPAGAVDWRLLRILRKHLMPRYGPTLERTVVRNALESGGLGTFYHGSSDRLAKLRNEFRSLPRDLRARVANLVRLTPGPHRPPQVPWRRYEQDLVLDELAPNVVPSAEAEAARGYFQQLLADGPTGDAAHFDHFESWTKHVRKRNKGIRAIEDLFAE